MTLLPALSLLASFSFLACSSAVNISEEIVLILFKHLENDLFWSKNLLQSVDKPVKFNG